MSYSQALESLNRIRNVFASDRGLNFVAGQFRKAQVNGEIPASMDIEEFAGSNYGWIGRAEPYYWSPTICRLLEETADSVPDATVTEDMLPTPQGYFYFANPLSLPGFGEHHVPLNGIGWRVMHEVPRGTRFLALAFLTMAADEPCPMVEATLPWEFGKPWGYYFTNPLNRDWIKAENITPRFIRQAQIMAAAVSFLSQRILVTRQERPPRATRKRLQSDGWTHEPQIRVVHLRRAANQGGEHGPDDHAVEWSCQWVVRGHWRLQACGPNYAERRPVFVLPYVKGDPDKPLKAPAERVFAVVR